MFKNYIKIIILIFCVQISFAQQNILPKNLIDKQKKFINNFPKALNNEKDYLKAIDLIKKYNPSFIENNKLIEEFTTIEKLLKKTILWTEKNATTKNQVICNKLYLLIVIKLQNDAQVIETINDIFRHKELLKPQEINFVLMGLSAYYFKLEAYNEVIKLIPLRRKHCVFDDTTLRAIDVDHDLSLACYKTKNYLAAIESFLVQKEYHTKNNEPLFVASMSNNIGLCYYNMQNTKKALYYFELAKKELNQTKGKESNIKEKGYNAFFGAVINTNIAKIDIDNKNYQKAIIAYNNLIQKTKIAGEKYNIPESYLNIAKIYVKTNQPKLAKIYLDSISNINANKLTTDYRIEFYTAKAKIELLNGNVNKANDLFDLSKKMNDSIQNEQSKRQSILAQVKYNSEEKEIALKVAQKNINSNEKLLTYQKIGLFITTFLILIIGVLYFNNLKKKKLIDKQNQILQINLSEKETLLKELHHRVKNNLQVIVGLLQLQSRKVKSPEMTELLIDSQQHINSMALVHEMLYQQNEFELVPMNKYLTELSKQISQNFLDKKVEIAIQCIDVELPINKAIPLGLMVSEMMTNSNKYAFENKTGTITIDLISKSANDFEFNYADSGKGLPENFEENKSKTMGLRLLQMLSEEMNGNLSIKNNNGFNANLIFNRNEKV